MDSNRSRHLGNSDDRVFDVSSSDHHQVVQFVNHQHNEWERIEFRGISLDCLSVKGFTSRLRMGFLCNERNFGSRVWWPLRSELPRAQRIVITRNISNAMVGENVVAPFHFLDGPCQCICCLFWIDDDRRQQLRKIVVLPQLDSFWVNQNQSDFIWRRTHQE